jgi:hypothetical protein
MAATPAPNAGVDEKGPAVTTEQTAGYTFFNHNLAAHSYATGDIYDGIPVEVEQDWELRDG